MNDLPRDLVLASAGYLILLLGLGTLGRRAKQDHSLADHFLASRSIGFGILLFTLFATQYSGNSLSGFPGKTYRSGLSYFMSVTFMVGIVSGYTLFAPRLFRIARARDYLTPTDFLADRFQSAALSRISIAIFVFVLANFLLAQLMAMGHAFSGLTENQIPYRTAVIVGAAVILVYELLGGMRAVAWTDALQGGILIVGLLLAVFLLVGQHGSPATVLAEIREVAPEKVSNPSLRTCWVWLSNFMLLGFGAPLYPQAIQRIFAARRLPELRRALSVMALLPLIAVTTVVFLGLVGIVMFPELSRIESDRVTFLVLGELARTHPAAYVPVLVVMLAALAAIMSTADSCLLSLTSIVIHDVGGLRAKGRTRSGNTVWVSTLILAALVLVALQPRLTLWGLLVLKFEVLIQLSPAFVLGTMHRADHPAAVRSREVLAGLAAGLGVFAILAALNLRNVQGFHAGTLGMIVNYLVVFTLWRIRTASPMPRGTIPS